MPMSTFKDKSVRGIKNKSIFVHEVSTKTYIQYELTTQKLKLEKN